MYWNGPPKGEAALLGDNLNLTSAAARAQSFAEAMQARYPGIRIVARPRGSFQLGQAEQEPKTCCAATLGCGHRVHRHHGNTRRSRYSGH